MYTHVYSPVNRRLQRREYDPAMAKTTTLADRLQTIMDSMGWETQVDLAKAAKTTRQVVQNWMKRGANQEIKARYAFNLQDRTRFNARWIIYGDGPERIVDMSPDEQRMVAKYRKMPVDKQAAFSTLLET